MQKQSWLARLFKFFRGETARLAASPVNESNVTQGTDWNGVYRDRYNYDRLQVLDQALLAWRLNPLARRIVEIGTQYITDGIEFRSEDEAAQAFLRDLWKHPLNRLGEHLKEWSDELALTGNLFAAITTDSAGMSYIRIYPTDLIASIETAPNDVQQERSYTPRATPADPQPRSIPNYYAARGRKARTVMLHFAVNRLAGMSWGEPDIAPLLPWLARYAAWIEDRMRLNRFRQAYLYIVKGDWPNEAARQARQAELTSNPPQPGSILVANSSEEWDVIHPRLDSFEANNDGLTLKKFILGGRGYPLHWLAEPESSTRTTAEAAGTPTFKGLESRQKVFLSMLQELLVVAAERGGYPDAEINVTAADISERDNASLALASTQVINSFGQLWANGFITDDEYLRVVYRFAGEVLPADRPDNPSPRVAPKGGKPAPDIKLDPDTGDVRTREPKS